MKKESEMTIERIEDVLREMDWTEIHKARVFGDYGDKVVLHTDGAFSVQDQSTHYRDPDAAGVIGYLSCWGPGNIDRTAYAEGWTARQEDGTYLVDSDYPDSSLAGQYISEDDMLEEAIAEDYGQDTDVEIEAVLRNLEQEREARYEASL